MVPYVILCTKSYFVTLVINSFKSYLSSDAFSLYFINQNIKFTVSHI